MNYNLLITICAIIFCHYFYPSESKYLSQPFTIISLIILLSIQNKFHRKRDYYQLVLLVLLWFTLIYDIKIAILIIIILLIDILTTSKTHTSLEGFASKNPNYDEDPNFKSSEEHFEDESDDDGSDTDKKEDEDEEEDEEENNEDTRKKNMNLNNIKLKPKKKKVKKQKKESFEHVSDRKITIMGEIRRILDDFDSGKNSLTAGEALMDISDVLHEQRKEEFDDIINGYADQEDEEEMYL